MDKKRVEIHLTAMAVDSLKQLAAKDKRSVKNYIETIVFNHINARRTLAIFKSAPLTTSPFK